MGDESKEIVTRLQIWLSPWQVAHVLALASHLTDTMPSTSAALQAGASSGSR